MNATPPPESRGDGADTGGAHPDRLPPGAKQEVAPAPPQATRWERLRRLHRVADWPRLARDAGRFVAARWRRLAFAIIALLLPLWGFGVMADAVHDGRPFAFDEPFLQLAHAHASPTLDRWMLFASDLGYQWFVVPADVALLVVLLLGKHVRKAIFVATAVIGSLALNFAAKSIFARERPSLWESIAPEHSYSFPSGHAMGAATLAAVLVLLTWNRPWRWPVLLASVGFALWVASSRVYLGVHYPSDILAGMIAAVAWCAVAYLIVRPHRHTGVLPDAG
jgi:undecaprenyl-diphosphatase